MYNCMNMTFLTLPRLPIGTSLERRFILLIEIRNNICMEIYLTHVGRGPYYYIVSKLAMYRNSLTKTCLLISRVVMSEICGRPELATFAWDIAI